MISKDHCIQLGTLTKPHGTKGSFVVWFRYLKAENIKEWGTVFLEVDGLLVPFFVEDFQGKSTDTGILKFRGINSGTKAKEFAGCKVFMQREQVARKRRQDSELPQLSGYGVKDLHKGIIGIAGEIEDIAGNPLLHIRCDNRQYLIPFHKDIILEVNHKHKEIVIEAPEGLFEL